MSKTSHMEHDKGTGDSFMIRAYTITIHPCVDTTGYRAICDMPNGGCVAQGETLQEVQRNMLEAMELYMEDYPNSPEYYLNFEVCHA